MIYKALMALTAVAAAPLVAAEQATPTDVTAQAGATGGNKIKCRSVAVTGSLAKREKVCLTTAEWKRRGDRGNDIARDMIDSGRVCSSCGNIGN